MSELKPRPAGRDECAPAAVLLAENGFRGWSEAALRASVEDGGLYVIGSPGTPVAAALGRWVVDEAELLALVVAPAVRRRGLGRAVLTALTTAAAARGARRLFLEVRSRNAAARALYAGAGFEDVGRRTGFYGDDDAVLMARTIGR